MYEMQRWHKIALIALVAILFLAAGSKAINQRSEQAALLEMKNGLTFSNTQTWDPEFYNALITGQEVMAYYRPRLTMAPPPNKIADIQVEIDVLHQLVNERTPKKVQQIEAELEIDGAGFNGKTLLGLFVGKPKSKELILKSLKILEPIEVAFKAEFDRVRPNIWDPSLSIVIDLPSHPAYPSYHAAEAMLVALIMKDLDPENSEIYISDAKRIAHNREIAGVHYPSDSAAGQKLAQDLLNLLQEESWYQVLAEEAKTEW